MGGKESRKQEEKISKSQFHEIGLWKGNQYRTDKSSVALSERGFVGFIGLLG